jgi:hypothetical protein
VIVVHLSRRVATDPVPRKPRRIITPQQFDDVYAALPSSDAQLLVETDIETGLRWGDLSELHVKDVDFATGLLTVSRAVIAVSRRHHPGGRRFWVKNYPKDGEYRKLRMSDQIMRKLTKHDRPRSRGRRPALRPAWGARTTHPTDGSPRSGDPRLDQAQRGGTTIPAWHHDRLWTGQVPLRALPPRGGAVPGRAAPQRQGPTGQRTGGGDGGRPTYQRQHVPSVMQPAFRAAGDRGGHHARPAPCACLMVASERSCISCIIRRLA